MTHPRWHRVLPRLFPWVPPGVALIFLALSASACTWFQVTLHPTTPPQPSTPSPESERVMASPNFTETEARPSAGPTVEAIPSVTPTPPRPTSTPSLDAQLDVLEDQVIALRGLRPTARIPRILSTSDSISRTWRETALQSSNQSKVEAMTSAFHLLGLADPEIELSDYLEMRFEATHPWAYYQRQQGQIWLPGSPTLTLDQQLSYIGAYMLALLDQQFPLPNGPVAKSTVALFADDAALALQALIAGDRALLQQQWLRIYGQALDSGARRVPPGDPCPPGDRDTTPLVVGPTDFACEYGLPFVRQAYLDGGWAGVDALYGNPPASTEILMHPETSSLSPQAIELTGLELPGPQWIYSARMTLGEWRLHKALSLHLSSRGARLASEGWGGDTLAAFEDEKGGAIGYLLLIGWDTVYDAAEFIDFFQEYLISRFPGLQAGEPGILWEGMRMASLSRRSGNRTLWVLAPDLLGVEIMAESLGFPGSSP